MNPNQTGLSQSDLQKLKYGHEQSRRQTVAPNQRQQHHFTWMPVQGFLDSKLDKAEELDEPTEDCPSGIQPATAQLNVYMGYGEANWQQQYNSDGSKVQVTVWNWDVNADFEDDTFLTCIFLNGMLQPASASVAPFVVCRCTVAPQSPGVTGRAIIIKSTVPKTTASGVTCTYEYATGANSNITIENIGRSYLMVGQIYAAFKPVGFKNYYVINQAGWQEDYSG